MTRPRSAQNSSRNLGARLDRYASETATVIRDLHAARKDVANLRAEKEAFHTEVRRATGKQTNTFEDVVKWLESHVRCIRECNTLNAGLTRENKTLVADVRRKHGAHETLLGGVAEALGIAWNDGVNIDAAGLIRDVTEQTKEIARLKDDVARVALVGATMSNAQEAVRGADVVAKEAEIAKLKSKIADIDIATQDLAKIVDA